MSKRCLANFLAIMILSSLAACGGGGGGSAGGSGTTTDTTPPTIASTSPASGATAIAVNAAIVVTFSEAIDPSTISTATFILSNGVTGSVTYSGTTATFTPSSSLAYSTTYTATITTGVKDAAGNAMAANKTWTFTTVIDPSPTATYTIGGTLTGLEAGKSITLANNGANFLTLVANGPFAFTGSLQNGAAFNLSIVTQPANQPCTSTYGAGNVKSANVTAIKVSCGPMLEPPLAAVAPGASLATARHSVPILLPDGRVLMAGGTSIVNGTFTYLASAEIYDPASNSWSAAGSLATARSSSRPILLPDGRVLIAGGQGIDGITGLTTYLASAEIYDPASNSWSAAGSLATARYSVPVLLPDGRVLMAGGTSIVNGTFTYLASAEIYDPASNSWSAAGSLATARYSVPVLLPDGRVLMAGGQGVDGITGLTTYLASAEIYDPASNSWSAAGTLATARSSSRPILLPDGRVLMAGGQGIDGITGLTTYLASAEIYDPTSNSWSAVGSLATARYSVPVLLPDGRVLMAGGTSIVNGTTTYLASAEVISGNWQGRIAGRLLTARTQHTAALLADGRVLAAGGVSAAGGVLVSTELYDSASNTWSAAGSLATARNKHTATPLPDGTVLVVGGSNAAGSVTLASTERYDPASNGWTAAAILASARTQHTATLLFNGNVLVAGGYGATALPLATAELYDPAADTWSPGGSLTTARVQHTETLLPSGKVLVAGGMGASGALASAELYDPASNNWSPAGSLAEARAQHTATLLPDGKVLVAGGMGSAGALASAELYDPATNSWTPAVNLAYARKNHTAALLPTGKVLVVGGSGANILGIAELYDPASNTWTTLASALRTDHTATLLPNGKLLVVGGGDSNGVALSSAEIYW